jgi:hypothetical protein
MKPRWLFGKMKSQAPGEVVRLLHSRSSATPANFIDRDTFRLFGCAANVPTFLSEGVSVADLNFDLRARVVEAVGIDALLGESVAVLLAKVHALDAFALETGVRLVPT